MIFFQSFYNFFHLFFELLSFRTKPKYEKVENNIDDEYEFIILNEKMNR